MESKFKGFQYSTAEIEDFFNEQLQNWELARLNFEGLKQVQVKKISFEDFDILVQYNPARIVSSGAKVDASTIAERKCFLCASNRPSTQNAIDLGEYELLVNPFPIFPEHFTLPRKDHVVQQIKPFFSDMLEIARILNQYVVFYNGPRCGASAPDHMHFQAGTKSSLPLIHDYKRLRATHTSVILEKENLKVLRLNAYLRELICIESSDIEIAKKHFEEYYESIMVEENVEPMMNIVVMYENDLWYVFVLPRKAFRPWQYFAEDDAKLLISPATVELSGVFITPMLGHFEKINKSDVLSILEQVS